MNHSIKPGSLKFFLDEPFISFYSDQYESSDRQLFSQNFDELVVVELSFGGEATGTSIKT